MDIPNSTVTGPPAWIARCRDFYVDVNKAAASGRQTLGRFDDDAAVRFVKDYVGNVEAELKPAD